MSKSTRRCDQQARQAPPRLPPLRSRHKAPGQEDSRQDALLRAAGPTPTSALAKYREQRDDLHAGRSPRVQSDGLTVRDLVNRFLTAKRNLLDFGEIMPRSFKDYYATCRARHRRFRQDAAGGRPGGRRL